MKKSDFDNRLLELSKECAYAILGGLAFSWNSVEEMNVNREEDAEWVQAQILFLFKSSIDKTAISLAP